MSAKSKSACVSLASARRAFGDSPCENTTSASNDAIALSHQLRSGLADVLSWVPFVSAVVVAYYQSAVTIEYLAQTYGFAKIVDALKLFGQGKDSAQVLSQITGKTIAQLDADFRAYLGVRLAPYAGTFKLPTRGLDDLTQLEVAADAAPRVRRALGRRLPHKVRPRRLRRGGRGFPPLTLLYTVTVSSGSSRSKGGV